MGVRNECPMLVKKTPVLVAGVFLCMRKIVFDPSDKFAKALALHQSGLLKDAESIYAELLEHIPETPDVLTNLGTLYLQRYEQQKQQSDLALGIETLQRSLAINPNQPNLHNNLAIVFIQQRLLEKALHHYDQAVALNGSTLSLHLMMGALLLDSGLAEESLVKFDAAIATNPTEANAWYNRGNALRTLRRFDEALTSYRRCIKLHPEHVEARINMGGLLHDLKEYQAAITYYDEALALRPDAINANFNRALALENTQNYAAAIAGYDRVLALSPAYPYLVGRRQFARMFLCDWFDYNARIRAVLNAVSSGFPTTVPFTCLSMTDDPGVQLQCAQTFSRDKFPAVVEGLEIPSINQKRRIRVGYFSSEFRTHAVGFLTAGLFEAHDRSEFEVFCFSLGAVPDSDPYTERIKSGCEHWVDASQMTEAEVVRMARGLGLDIAVDLAGHTMDARTRIFAQRVAPVQVNYLGYPGSMGAPYMDVILADDIVAPEGVDDDYTEQVVRLPACFQVNDRQRAIGSVLSRADYGLPQNALVLASFNTSYKLNPALFDIWCRLLFAAPGSVLWLLGETPDQMNYLCEAAAVRGVEPGRLVFARRMAYADHLARYAHVDLVLDTWPFNGGTSTSDALWGGAPVLTMTGRSFASRMSASLLNAVGLPELVTDSMEAYDALGLVLVIDAQRLVALKAHLKAVRLSCPLFDTAKTTRDIEDAYQALLQQTGSKFKGSR